MVHPPLGTVVRKATGADLFAMNKHKRMEEDATRTAAEMVRARAIPMKILGADWQFDGSSLVFFFSSDDRVDLTELNAALAAHFGTRIEFRKMGARDETKVMTGVGTCGRELCCSSWLDKFSNISIRMAKEQDLPLNQSKLTGVWSTSLKGSPISHPVPPGAAGAGRQTVVRAPGLAGGTSGTDESIAQPHRKRWGVPAAASASRGWAVSG